MREREATSDAAAPRTTRGLLVLRAGGRAFAVYAEEAEGVAEAPRPVPLPHAPAAVLGVVSVRGRMYTLLDTAALVAGRGANSTGHAPRFAVALRGDEQLALAADEVEGPLELDADADEPPALHTTPLRATLERGGAPLHLLDPARLFDAAMQGTERRRQRS
jgi:purine-binding chemotaxis protein CheW